jgi:predicted secreted protein
MPAILGANCKLYRNTGTYGTPVWDLIDIVRDLTLSLDKSEADATTRAAAGWKQFLAGLKTGSVEFDVIWDTGHLDFIALQGSFANNTILDIAVMDGPIATAGSAGLRAEMVVFTLTRNESLEEAVTASITCKPAYSANPPVWFVAV